MSEKSAKYLMFWVYTESKFEVPGHNLSLGLQLADDSVLLTNVQPV